MKEIRAIRFWRVVALIGALGFGTFTYMAITSPFSPKEDGRTGAFLTFTCAYLWWRAGRKLKLLRADEPKSREWLGILIFQWGFGLLSAGEYALIFAGLFQLIHFLGAERDLALFGSLIAMVSMWVHRFLSERREQAENQYRLLNEWHQEWIVEMDVARSRFDCWLNTTEQWGPQPPPPPS